jgi:hypothetical protein
MNDNRATIGAIVLIVAIVALFYYGISSKQAEDAQVGVCLQSYSCRMEWIATLRREGNDSFADRVEQANSLAVRRP